MHQSAAAIAKNWPRKGRWLLSSNNGIQWVSVDALGPRVGVCSIDMDRVDLLMVALDNALRTVAAGVNHFLMPDTYVAIVPPYLPFPTSTITVPTPPCAE